MTAVRAEDASAAAETRLGAGELVMVVQRHDDGIRLTSLSDSGSRREFLSERPLPLFSLTLRHAETGEQMHLNADAGWGKTAVESPDPHGAVHLRWQEPKDARWADTLRALSVHASATPDDEADAIRWRLRIDNATRQWSVWRVAFPQLALAELGPDAEVFVPRAAGEVQRGLWQRDYRFRETYPAGWSASMPWMAAYAAAGATGLYFAMHDPLGSVKDVLVESRSADRTVVLAFDHPAENMDRPGNRFATSGEAVWRLLRGDWFDAATIYRDWVSRHARWYPQLEAQGRGDTPPWMRELPVWVITGGSPQGCVGRVKEFAKFMGVPVGFHWYNWHTIPFDNDYPHYFPAKEGFAEAVASLQESGVYVMPYINGRLWDTRDRGTEDWQFSGVALAAATKDQQAKPYVETYGSQEADDSPVRLAVMCPATDVWQGKVRQIVLRLFGECGVKAVYIDQVAAAQPRLCYDASHGHPTGGGSWWNEAYWQMLGGIRREMPEGRVLTTECNAETFVHCFDGYLTWHWQYDGQVPAFPAVYGGAIQMFGRAYRGGDTKDLALRMKAAQQLVFGEQLGWLDPGVVAEQQNAEFLRQLVRLRWHLRRYFHAGRMARPPRLEGHVPRVRADWQWRGEWWVTTDAVLTGAWALAAEKRCVLLFVNVDDQAVSAALSLDAGTYGLPGDQVRLSTLGAEGPNESLTVRREFRRELTLPPRSAQAWELSSP